MPPRKTIVEISASATRIGWRSTIISAAPTSAQKANSTSSSVSRFVQQGLDHSAPPILLAAPAGG